MDTDGQVLHHSTLRMMRAKIAELEERNAELLAALERLTAACESSGVERSDIVAARAALAKVSP